MIIKLEVKTRDDKGKGASRRLRHQGLIPGIVYGINKKPVAISIDFHKLDYLLEYNEAIYTSIINLSIDGKNQDVILKDLQRNPRSNFATHADFLRVDNKHNITTIVPLNFIGAQDNEALRLGAMLNEFINSIEVVCLAKDLPQSIDVDITALKLDEHIGLLDINMPDNVVIKALTHGEVESHNQTVVSVAIQRKVAEEDIEQATPADEADDTEDKDTNKEDK